MSQKKAFSSVLGARAAWAATHTNSKFGSDAICYLAEAVAPGFEHHIQKRIEALVQKDFDEALKEKVYAISCFLPWNRRYFFFLHLIALWIGVKLVERHDPYKPTYGDLFEAVKNNRKEKNQ